MDPGGTGSQSAKPLCARKVPGAHSRQSELPVALAKVPGKQGEQLSELFTGLYWPSGLQIQIHTSSNERRAGGRVSNTNV